ncbi:gephyrin-like molybdotransferase Glp [Psychrobacter sp. 16-MNA-CIBAN-0192]|uniref:molybdopterin molybdotransferase MoeA n=1 Tax=Psychrobacter sp. 16-MNA-CIBAN-0192 TaxID=3140448 RepID=UPI0033318CCB
MISLEQLQHAVAERIQHYNKVDFPVADRAVQTLALLDSQQRILAQDIISPFAVPRNNLSAMDGYALAAGSTLNKGATIEIIGESQAGTPFAGSLQAGQGVRIFTGAVVPNACDTVIMQENTDFLAIKETLVKSKPYAITLTEVATIDTHIRKQGEEIEQNEVVLSAGKRLNPADISLLANLGVANVDVYQPLTVGILATGDELVALGEPLTSLAQIYNSNTPTLNSMLKDLPIVIRNYGIIPDNLDATIAAVTDAMHDCDVLISTAGVSVGDYDFLTTVIEQLGQINHYKVAMKPGKPFVFGELNKGIDKPILYFGLPGNPLSTVVGALQLVIPALWQLAGVNKNDMPMMLTVQATLSADIKKAAGRKDFQRGILVQNANGLFTVTSLSKQQSHRIKQLSQANCLIVLAQDAGNVSAGEKIMVQPFPWS